MLNTFLVMPNLIRHLYKFYETLKQVQGDIFQIRRSFFRISLLLAFLPFYTYAVQGNTSIQAEIISSSTHLGQRDSLLMGVKVSMASGWQIYAPQQDESFSPPHLEDMGSINVKQMQLLWPKVRQKEQGGLKALIYEGDQIFPLLVTVELPLQEAHIKAKFSFVGCKEGQCIPFIIPLSYDIKKGEGTPTSEAASLESALKHSSDEPQIMGQQSSLTQGSVYTTSVILLFAFLGGFLLNFMPCVLPVLSFKIFSLLKKKASMEFFETHHLRLRFFMSFLGILSFFIFFSLITIVMKVFGHTLGWGAQFQQPLFLGIMIVILSVFGLSLWGFFEIQLPSGFLSWMSGINTKLDRVAWSPFKKAVIKDFFSGLLTALLATPCTAPFLGVAIGASFAYSYEGTFVVFTAIGLGLGFPYILLATFPRVLKLLPKPGPWMEKLKKILALCLWITALWLAYVLAIPLMNKKEGEGWHVFEENKISKLVQEGKPVLVNITASWCLTCKANELLVFKDPKIQEILKRKGVYLMEGDWTRSNPQIQSFLEHHHRRGIPLTIYYSQVRPEGIILPEILTATVVEKALEK